VTGEALAVGVDDECVAASGETVAEDRTALGGGLEEARRGEEDERVATIRRPWPVIFEHVAGDEVLGIRRQDEPGMLDRGWRAVDPERHNDGVGVADLLQEDAVPAAEVEDGAAASGERVADDRDDRRLRAVHAEARREEVVRRVPTGIWPPAQPIGERLQALPERDDRLLGPREHGIRPATTPSP
jgi:hypothetical protein